MRSNTPSPPAPPPVPEGVDDVRRQADARETAAEGSAGWCAGRRPKLAAPGATMATSRADLDALRLTENDGRETDGSGRAATSATTTSRGSAGGCRWWRRRSRRRTARSCRRGGRRPTSPPCPPPWPRATRRCAAPSPARSSKTVHGFAWRRGSAGCARWASAAMGVQHVPAGGAGSAPNLCRPRRAAHRAAARRRRVPLLHDRPRPPLTDLQILSLRAAGVRIATVVAVDSHFAEICTATAEAGPAPDTKVSRRLRRPPRVGVQRAGAARFLRGARA